MVRQKHRLHGSGWVWGKGWNLSGLSKGTVTTRVLIFIVVMFLIALFFLG